MTQQDLISQAFTAINSYKRHRALQDLEGHSKHTFHELKKYKMIDQLELSLRAIQKEIRENQSEPEEVKK